MYSFLCSTKGYLETAEKEQKGTNLAHLLAKSYTIEDKLKDDDRNSRRERYGGPTSTFTEKSGYVPNVQVKSSKHCIVRRKLADEMTLNIGIVILRKFSEASLSNAGTVQSY
jgi:hypothetical protein